MLLKRLKHDSISELSLNDIQKDAKKSVEEKVENGIYSFETIICPVCQTSNSTLIGEKDRYGLSYSTNICSGCGLVYVNPRMNEGSYAKFYNEEYRPLYVGKEKPASGFFESQKRKGKKIHEFLSNHNLIQNDNLRVLEVGCGAGGILHYFKSVGFEIQGIDLGEEYVNYGIKEHNLPLQVSTLGKLEIEYKPDLIIYSHVMEHILDLNKELNLIKEISHPDTVLYIEVPGIKHIHKSYRSNILRYFQNAHTFHFSLESLNNILSKNGFKLVVGNQFVQSAFKLEDHDFSIKNDHDEVKSYILNTERTRRFYFLTPTGIKENFVRLIVLLLSITRTKGLIKKIKG